MDKIEHQALEPDAVQEIIHVPADGLHVDAWNIESGTRTNGLTSAGYDDETGLWEELKHRHGLDKAWPETPPAKQD